MSTATLSNATEFVNVSATPTTEPENNIEGTSVGDMKETIKFIDFEKLVPDHTRNPRLESKYTANGPAGDKARSIHKHGLLNPLLVSKRSDGTYAVLQGHLRHGGIKLIRTVGMPAKGKEWPAIEADPNFMNKVQCRVREGLTPAQELDLIMDHGTTTSLDKREQYNAVKTMYRAGFAEKMIAEKTGKSRGPVSVLIRVARMPQVIEDMYLADPKSEGYIALSDQAVNDLFKAYNEDRADGCKPKEAGLKFSAVLEKIVSSGNPPRVKAMPATALVAFAETETDPDIRDLFNAIGENDKDAVNAATERLHIRLTPFYGKTTVVEEGIQNVL